MSWNHIRKQDDEKTAQMKATSRKVTTDKSKRTTLTTANEATEPPKKAPRLGATVTRRKNLSTEELQCQKAKKEASQAAAVSKANAARVAAVLYQQPASRSRAPKPPTIPEEFHLMTNYRCRSCSMTTRSMAAQQREWKSLAQKVAEFDKTPQRCKPVAPGKPPVLPQWNAPGLTIPHSPELMTKARAQAALNKGIDHDQLHQAANEDRAAHNKRFNRVPAGRKVVRAKRSATVTYNLRSRQQTDDQARR